MRSYRWWCACAVALAAAGGCSKSGEDEGDKSPDMLGNAGTNSSGPNDNMNEPKAGSGSGSAGTQATGSGGTSPTTGKAGTGSTPPANNAGTASNDPPPEVEKLDPNVDWTALKLFFPNLYSAYDGEHEFKIPVHVEGVSVELSGWEAIPASAVVFELDPEGGGVMITVVEAVEDITIAAHNGMIGGTAKLNVTLATPAEWAVGEARYANDVEYTLPELDFAQLIDPNWVPPETPKNLACNNCHTTGAKYFEIQHTPTQIGGLSDEDLITILTTGMKPAGVPFHVLPEDFQHLYPQFHTWEASEEERKGLIVYLRSLTPAGQDDIVLPGM